MRMPMSVDVQLVARLEGDHRFLPVLAEARRAAGALELALAVADVHLEDLDPEALLHGLLDDELVGACRHLEDVGVQGLDAAGGLLREQRPPQDPRPRPWNRCRRTRIHHAISSPPPPAALPSPAPPSAGPAASAAKASRVSTMV